MATAQSHAALKPLQRMVRNKVEQTGCVQVHNNCNLHRVCVHVHASYMCGIIALNTSLGSVGCVYSIVVRKVNQNIYTVEFHICLKNNGQLA